MTRVTASTRSKRAGVVGQVTSWRASEKAAARLACAEAAGRTGPREAWCLVLPLVELLQLANTVVHDRKPVGEKFVARPRPHPPSGLTGGGVAERASAASVVCLMFVQRALQTGFYLSASTLPGVCPTCSLFSLKSAAGLPGGSGYRLLSLTPCQSPPQGPEGIANSRVKSCGPPDPGLCVTGPSQPLLQLLRLHTAARGHVGAQSRKPEGFVQDSQRREVHKNLHLPGVSPTCSLFSLKSS